MTGVIAATLLAACGSEYGIVGGECADGFTRCGGSCVDLTNDPSHCGACGNVCGAGSSCIASACTTSPSGSSSSGGTPPSGSDAGGTSDAGSTAHDDASTSNEDASAADDASAANDASAKDSSANGDAGVEPDAEICAAPKMECGASGCVDVRTSVQHCGSCDAFCATGRCVDGICEGAVAGHVVLIGHDYVGSLTSDTYLSSQERLLGNAALLGPSRAIRLVAVETFADPTAVTNVRTILMRAAAEAGRPLELRTTDDPGSVERADTDVVLVHDQVAGAGRFAARATAAREPLGRFLGASGVVIVLDGASAGREMLSFTRDAGLFAVDDHVAPSGLFFVDARDAVGYGVAAPYSARPHATAFSFGATPPAGAWITVADGSGAPVVLHAAR